MKVLPLILIAALLPSISIAQTDNENIIIVSDFFDKYLPREMYRINSALKKSSKPESDIDKIKTNHILYGDIVKNIELRALNILNNAPFFQSWDKNKIDLARKKLRSNLSQHHVLNIIDNIGQVYYDHKKQGHSLAMCDTDKSYNQKRYGDYKICVSNVAVEGVELHITIRSKQSWVWHFKNTGKRYALYDIVSDTTEKMVIGLLMLGK